LEYFQQIDILSKGYNIAQVLDQINEWGTGPVCGHWGGRTEFVDSTFYCSFVS
jgi:hypothetical protein